MISESLAALRMARGVSQETVAEAAGVSRQAYARWEQGETLPDIERCAKLAQFFGTTVDAMIAYQNGTVQPPLLPGPPGKHIWGTVTVGERGQIVIPKAARETFGLTAGSRLIVLGDETEGIALVKVGDFEARLNVMLGMAHALEE